MDIDVKTGKLREKVGDQKNIRNELNQINSSVQTSRRKLRSCLSSSASGKIDKSLDVACKSLQNITNWIGDMADGLDTIAGLYEAAEQDISGNKPSGEAVREAGGTGAEDATIRGKDIILDILKSVFRSGALLSSAAILANLVIALMEKLGNVIPKSSGSSLDALWINEILENVAVGKSQPAEAVEKKSSGEGSSSAQSNSKKTAGGTGSNENPATEGVTSSGAATQTGGTSSTIDFSSLEEKYPSGSKWSSSYKNKAWQCHGFALTLGDSLTGTDPNSWNKAYNLNSLKPGDIIVCNRPHTIMVTGVSGDEITYVDCNWAAKDTVKWNNTISRSQIANKFNSLKYVLEYP